MTILQRIAELETKKVEMYQHSVSHADGGLSNVNVLILQMIDDELAELWQKRRLEMAGCTQGHKEVRTSRKGVPNKKSAYF